MVSGTASLSGSIQFRPEVMSSRWPTVMAFLEASALATLRSTKKSSTGASREAISPSWMAMPVSVATTPLVVELTACLSPSRYGA